MLTSLCAGPISAQDNNYILVLQGESEGEYWYSGFNQAFRGAFAEDSNNTIIITQNLGLNRAVTPEIRERLLVNTARDVEELGIDLVISLLPSAADFLLELDIDSNIPQIRVLPAFVSSAETELSPNVRTVNGAGDLALEGTLEQILLLRPDLETIEVIAGNHPTNLLVVESFRNVAANFQDSITFNYHVGESPEELQRIVSALPDTAVLFSLANTHYGNETALLPSSVTEDLLALASVPAFGYLDTDLDLGIVGGSLSSTAAYADSAAQMAKNILFGATNVGISELTSTATIYDWNQVARWDLDLNRLDAPYILVNEPISFWREYPIITAVAGNILLLLIGLVGLQAILLNRARRARLTIENSEKVAKESESKYRLLASNSVDVIWVWDAELRQLTYCSPSVERVLGFGVEEFLQQPMDSAMTPESFSRYYDAFFGSEPQAQMFEAEYYSKSGDVVYCESTLQPSELKAGRASKWVGVTRDISKRRENEKHRQSLEAQVIQVQKFESLGTLAGGIAHDFNNILSVIMGITDVLETEMAGNKTGSKMLKKLMSASQKAKQLVQQILTFSRQREGKKIVTDINSLIEDSLEIVEAGIPSSISLEKRLNADSLHVKADPGQLSQVIVNLLTNAFEATDGSQGQISISLRRRDLEHGKSSRFVNLEPGSYAEIEIWDNGMGIDKTEIDKIFDPFYTSKELGNGMGLAIVQSIVIDHGGAIDIESARGLGTTMTILWPLTDEELSVQSDVAVTPSVKSQRIIVVDDQEQLLDTYKIMLGHLGHKCIPCADPETVISLIAEQKELPDLIITDYSMPGLSGLELAHLCTQEYPAIPIVISTGYGQDITETATTANGISAVLNKPFTLNELRQVLHEDSRGLL